MLPELAALEDLEQISSTPVDNWPRASAILSAASTLVRSFSGRVWVDAAGEWEDGVSELQKDQVKTVVLSVTERVYTNPLGATYQTVGPFARSVAAWAALGLALTDDEKTMLGGGSAGVSGLSSIRLLAPPDATGVRYSHEFWEDEDEEEGS